MSYLIVLRLYTNESLFSRSKFLLAGLSGFTMHANGCQFPGKKLHTMRKRVSPLKKCTYINFTGTF